MPPRAALGAEGGKLPGLTGQANPAQQNLSSLCRAWPQRFCLGAKNGQSLCKALLSLIKPSEIELLQGCPSRARGRVVFGQCTKHQDKLPEDLGKDVKRQKKKKKSCGVRGVFECCLSEEMARGWGVWPLFPVLLLYPFPSQH